MSTLNVLLNVDRCCHAVCGKAVLNSELTSGGERVAPRLTWVDHLVDSKSRDRHVVALWIFVFKYNSCSSCDADRVWIELVSEHLDSLRLWSRVDWSRVCWSVAAAASDSEKCSNDCERDSGLANHVYLLRS